MLRIDPARTHLFGLRVNVVTSIVLVLLAVIYLIVRRNAKREDPARLRGRPPRGVTDDPEVAEAEPPVQDQDQAAAIRSGSAAKHPVVSGADQSTEPGTATGTATDTATGTGTGTATGTGAVTEAGAGEGAGEGAGAGSTSSAVGDAPVIAATGQKPDREGPPE
jgi:hypothetical protein